MTNYDKLQNYRVTIQSSDITNYTSDDATAVILSLVDHHVHRGRHCANNKTPSCQSGTVLSLDIQKKHVPRDFAGSCDFLANSLRLQGLDEVRFPEFTRINTVEDIAVCTLQVSTETRQLMFP